MDRAKFRADLLDAIRSHLPGYERSARVTCLVSVRLDGSDESAVFLDIVEDLAAAPMPAVRTTAASAAATATVAAAAAPAEAVATSKAEKSSKRKSQAPQKMVANGLDSFVAASSGGGGDPAAASASADPPSAATVKKETGGSGCLGFYVNNPSFQQHFLLPTGFLTAASVFPSPTAVFQPTRPQQQQPQQSQQQQQQQSAVSDSLKSPTADARLDILGSSNSNNSGVSSGNVTQSDSKRSGQRSRSLFGLRSRRGGHRSFPCNQCPEAFASLASLSKHTYSLHKSYKCTFCSASFTQRSNLQRHSLKHVGFKPFACRCCQKSYYRKDHLVRHIEVTHPGNEPKRNIETKLTSSECLEFLERRYETGEYSITIDGEGDGEGDGEVDEEMPDEEELDEATGADAEVDSAMQPAEAGKLGEEAANASSKAEPEVSPDVEEAAEPELIADAEVKVDADLQTRQDAELEEPETEQRWLQHQTMADSAESGTLAAEASA
ncbi:hypothetical protein BOX15_Mlig034494g1 [Macrostomum lignano]|uniref:C2H2-type domain-containing protein n=1 Tax=Macrostomum lignano TaxID=282301 RepID=A0A267GXP2_9PLAT|nr:hypothetical protein BOX15_Mlig034494g1 [Macrostomum lignano]